MLSTQIRSYVNILFNSKLIFKFPKKNRIILFDDIGHDYLNNYKINHSVLDIRFCKINIAILLKSIFQRKYSKNIKLRYFILYIQKICPKLIITFNDNRLDFYKLKKFFPSIRFISIQNGWRGYKDDIFEILDVYNLKDLSCDYIFTFNKYISNKYKNHINAKFINIGSYKSNAIEIKNSKSNHICLISQFQKFNNINDTISHYEDKPITWKDFIKTDELVFKLIDSLELNKDHEVTIYLRNSGKFVEIEKKFYKKIFNKTKIRFIKKHNIKKMFAYLDSCKLIITIDSTLGYEMLSRNKKVIFLTLRESISKSFLGYNYGWPKKYPKIGPFWCSFYDFKKIEKIIFSILRMGQNEWKRNLSLHSCMTNLSDTNLIDFINEENK